MADYPTLPPDALYYYDPQRAIWGDEPLAPVAPVGVGVDRVTGQVLIGWPHVRQSINAIFHTRFHTRILRGWVGSMVPHILGESGVPRIIQRFYGAIQTAIDLWEPRYRIKRVFFQGYAIGDAYSPAPPSGTEEFRIGHLFFRNEGVYMPRGHLGDPTPLSRQLGGLVDRGGRLWDNQAG